MDNLKLKNNKQLILICILSAIIILGVAFTSAYGIIKSDEVYVTQEMADANIPNDIATLVFAVPIAIIFLLFAAKNKSFALICLSGILYYFMYNNIVYFFEVPLSPISILYVISIGISLAAIVMIIAAIDKNKVTDKLRNVVPAKFAGGVLILLGIFVLGFQVSEIMTEAGRKALCFADIALGVPVMLASGIYLIKKKPFGYIAGGAMLFSYVMQSIGLILYFFADTMVRETPLDIAGIVVVAFMAVLCAVPFAFFIKGFKKARE